MREILGTWRGVGSSPQRTFQFAIEGNKELFMAIIQFFAPLKIECLHATPRVLPHVYNKQLSFCVSMLSA
jgi:hypothetical protein